MNKTETRDLRPPNYVASYLNRSPQTLANWRWRRIGPGYFKINGNVMYDMTEVRAWLDRLRVEPGRHDAA